MAPVRLEGARKPRGTRWTDQEWAQCKDLAMAAGYLRVDDYIRGRALEPLWEAGKNEDQTRGEHSRAGVGSGGGGARMR